MFAYFRVFISYSHDDATHRERVLVLSEALRRDGFDCTVDQYVKGTPEKGWPLWTLDQIEQADFVLLVCTSAYYRRFRGLEQPGIGNGVTWEGAIVSQEIYFSQRSAKFVPVFFGPAEPSLVPEPTRQHTHYNVDDPVDYGALCDFLLGAAGVEPAPLAADGHAARRPRPRPSVIWARVLRSADDIQPAFENDEARRTSESIAEARDRRARLQASGADTRSVDRELLELRRQLRQGGQLRAGDLLADRYLLVEVLGGGGFGTVWKALDATTSTYVAMKILHPDKARDATKRERFFRGARIMAKLKHAGVVRVLQECAQDEGYFYFVLELIDGTNLHEAIVAKSILAPRAIELLIEVGCTLSFAHENGVVHRDVKPANILVTNDGRAKLTDFDLVKANETTGGTETGAMGTLLFAAPEELLHGGLADARSDIYSLAMTAVFCFARSLTPAVLRRPEQVIAGLECNQAMKRVLTRALAPEPWDRYQRMEELCSALDLALKSSPPTSSRFSKRVVGKGAAIGSVVVLAVSAGFWVASKPHAPPPGQGAARLTAGVPSLLSAAAKPPLPLEECPPGMSTIPAGQFYQGSDAKDAPMTQKPSHNVTLSAFCIDTYEVTSGEYKACSDDGKCKRLDGDVDWPKISSVDKSAYGKVCTIRNPDLAKHPMNCLQWDHARRYCEVQGKRLPTESEWEYAARGPDGRVYPWGNEAPTAEHLNACGLECLTWAKRAKVLAQFPGSLYLQDDGWPTTAPVGSFPAGRSRFGPQDVVGNVWEWVADWHGPYDNFMQTNPRGPAQGTKRVIRGGAWNASFPEWLHPQFRYGTEPEAMYHGVGFRCAKGLATDGEQVAPSKKPGP